MRTLRNAVTLSVAIVCATAATSITPASAGRRTTGSIAIESIVGSPSGAFTQGNGDSRAPSASTDGRYVAFESDATNLVPNDTNDSTDVFLRDNLTLAITRVSALLANGKQTNDDSYDATISADGSKVAYVSNADGITPDDHNGGGDAYVYNVHAHTVVARAWRLTIPAATSTATTTASISPRRPRSAPTETGWRSPPTTGCRSSTATATTTCTCATSCTTPRSG